MELGKRIRELRKEKGLTQKKLSEMSDITQAHLSRIENESVFPSISAIRQLAVSLDMTAARLLFISCDSEDYGDKRVYDILHGGISYILKSLGL